MIQLLHNFFMSGEYCRSVMKISFVSAIIFLSAVTLILFSPVYAEEKGTTPYGDYCRACSQYGACKEALPPGDAVKAIDSYYRERGYSVGSVQHKGRFMEAEIYKDNKQVDKVLLDRKTGRLRSTY